MKGYYLLLIISFLSLAGWVIFWWVPAMEAAKLKASQRRSPELYTYNPSLIGH